MKKILAITLIAVFALTVFAAANEMDYKVIKNAVNKGAKSTTLSDDELADLTLKITVFNTKKNEMRVEVTVPLGLVLLFEEMCPNEDFTIHGHNDIELGKVIKMLKTAGKTAAIEVSNYDENERVKIWVE